MVIKVNAGEISDWKLDSAKSSTDVALAKHARGFEAAQQTDLARESHALFDFFYIQTSRIKGEQSCLPIGFDSRSYLFCWVGRCDFFEAGVGWLVMCVCVFMC